MKKYKEIIYLIKKNENKNTEVLNQKKVTGNFLSYFFVLN